MLDRIDLHVDVAAVSAADLVLPPPAEGSAEVRARVALARNVQSARYGVDGPRTNAEVDGELLEEHATPDEPGRRLLAQAAEAMRLPRYYPAIIDWLGYNPLPDAQTNGARLRRERLMLAPVNPRRVLALHVTTRGFAFCLFDGPGQLYDWGIKHVARGDKNKQSLAAIEHLIVRYDPQGCRRKIPIDTLEAIFQSELDTFAFAPETLDENKRRMSDALQATSDLIEGHEQSIARLDGQIDSLLTLHQSGAIDQDGFAKRYKPLGDRNRELSAELPRLVEKRQKLSTNLNRQADVVAETQDVAQRYPAMPFADRRRLVETVVERVTVGDDEVEFGYLFDPRR